MIKESIRHFLQWLADKFGPSAEEQMVAKAAQEYEERHARAVAKSQAYQLAEQMQQRLHAKRNRGGPLNDILLTVEEKADRDAFLKNRTKREDCYHLKGPIATRWGLDIYGPRAGRVKDYNVSQHTFLDGRTRIRCLWNCGFEVYSDTQDRAKWKLAVGYAKESSNRASSSEIWEKPALITNLEQKIED